MLTRAATYTWAPSLRAKQRGEALVEQSNTAKYVGLIVTKFVDTTSLTAHTSTPWLR